MRISAVVAVALALAAQGAATAEGALALRDAAEVEVAAALSAELPRGSLKVEGERASGRHELRGLDGAVRVITRSAVEVDLPGGGQVRPQGPEDVTTISLSNGTIELVVEAELFVLEAATREGGAIRVVGALSARGTPRWLEHPVASETTSGLLESPDYVSWRWEAGHAFVGRAFTWHAERFDGFPAPEIADLSIEGPAKVSAFGGNVTIKDARGTTTFRLGSWSEAQGASVVQTVRRLVFDGRVAGSTMRVSDGWGAGAPTVAWDVDGVATFRDATGRASAGGSSVDFERKDVDVAGRFRTVPLAPNGAPIEPAQPYGAFGDFALLRVGGVSVAAPATGLGTAAGLSIGAVLLAALLGVWKAAAVLYSRILPSEVLDHPTRRAIYEAVVASSGVHKRELQRIAGCAWGPFTFHLKTLVAAGYVRIARHGAYSVVQAVAPGAAVGGPVLPHPVARAIFAALPPDGSSVPMQQVRRAVGVSPQLLRYHVHALARQGLVRAGSGEGRGKVLARLPAQNGAPLDG